MIGTHLFHISNKIIMHIHNFLCIYAYTCFYGTCMYLRYYKKKIYVATYFEIFYLLWLMHTNVLPSFYRPRERSISMYMCMQDQSLDDDDKEEEIPMSDCFIV